MSSAKPTIARCAAVCHFSPSYAAAQNYPTTLPCLMQSSVALPAGCLALPTRRRVGAAPGASDRRRGVPFAPHGASWTLRKVREAETPVTQDYCTHAMTTRDKERRSQFQGCWLLFSARDPRASGNINRKLAPIRTTPPGINVRRSRTVHLDLCESDHDRGLLVTWIRSGAPEAGHSPSSTSFGDNVGNRSLVD